MIKRLVLFVVALLVISCGPPRYTVMQETNSAANVASANAIFVGWLQLDEQKYQEHGYNNAGEFRKAIQTMNAELQRALRETMPNKRFTFASDPTTQPPPAPSVEMVIVFQDAALQDTGGGMNGHNGTTLKTTVRFFDHRAQREIKSAAIQTSIRGMNGWAAYNLEACIDQAGYNVGVYISEKLAGGV
jgi:hypothetical protein